MTEIQERMAILMDQHVVELRRKLRRPYLDLLKHAKDDALVTIAGINLETSQPIDCIPVIPSHLISVPDQLAQIKSKDDTLPHFPFGSLLNVSMYAPRRFSRTNKEYPYWILLPSVGYIRQRGFKTLCGYVSDKEMYQTATFTELIAILRHSLRDEYSNCKLIAGSSTVRWGQEYAWPCLYWYTSECGSRLSHMVHSHSLTFDGIQLHLVPMIRVL